MAEHRPGLASRFAAFHRSVRDVPPIKVVVDYGQSAAQMAEGVGDG